MEGTPATPVSSTLNKESLPSDQASRLLAENTELKAQVEALQQRVAWFEKQYFGQKSEKRVIENPHQNPLFNFLGDVASPVANEKETITYTRGKAKKKRPDDCLTDSGLRFSEDVPIQVITLNPPELNAPEADQYEIIDTKVSHKLAQRPASYVVLQYERPVIKKKGDDQLITAPMLPQVLDNSLADVSLLVGLLVDKFQYHLPLYRQHQRMQQAGIALSRTTLSNLSKRAIELLRPIVAAQLAHVLQSKVLSMDETPIKAGRQAKGGGRAGKMKQAWFWPLYGEADEVIFTYSSSRGRQHIEALLKTEFNGTLLSDGYAAYARYVEQSEGITHAQCWVHTRRQFIEAEPQAPEQTKEILDAIGALYQIEATITEQSLKADAKHQFRLGHSKPIVDQIFEWCYRALDEPSLTPKHPLTKAIKYTLRRETQLRVFLEDPDVPMDTNHLERSLRAIPLGRKNWMFCWTELGAEHVGIIQSLIVTCRLHDINPYIYLTDVLQRISVHPASQVEELTPRVWKEKFASNPMRSILIGGRQDVQE